MARPKPFSAGLERRFSAASVGRISVNPEGTSVLLDLFQWSLKPDALLTPGEAREIASQLVKAADSIAPIKRYTTASDVAEDDPDGIG